MNIKHIKTNYYNGSFNEDINFIINIEEIQVIKSCNKGKSSKIFLKDGNNFYVHCSLEELSVLLNFK